MARKAIRGFKAFKVALGFKEDKAPAGSEVGKVSVENRVQRAFREVKETLELKGQQALQDLKASLVQLVLKAFKALKEMLVPKGRLESAFQGLQGFKAQAA
jgi:hypothetical protein